MTLARGTPVPGTDGAVIPPGRYWLDSFADAKNTRKQFLDWLKSKPEVKQETSQEDADSDPPHLFSIFVVPAGVSNFGLAGVLFPTKALGFPTVAPPSVTSSDDTVQRPPPAQNALDVLGDQLTGANGANLLKGVIFAGVAVGAIALLVSVGPALLAVFKRRK